MVAAPELAAGAVQVTGGELRMQDGVAGTPSLEREADLLGTPGLNLTTAFLTFDFRTSNTLENQDQISVAVSGNGGGIWTTLETFSNDGSGSRSYNITGQIANNTRVRFQLSGAANSYADADEFFFVDNLQITDGAVTAGHWEVRVDMAAGDDINALGIRAHDGTSGAGGTELNVYFDSFTQFGINPPASRHEQPRSYDVFPYITSGCTVYKNDFDYDSNRGNTGSMSFSSRAGSLLARAFQHVPVRRQRLAARRPHRLDLGHQQHRLRHLVRRHLDLLVLGRRHAERELHHVLHEQLAGGGPGGDRAGRQPDAERVPGLPADRRERGAGQAVPRADAHAWTPARTRRRWASARTSR